MRHVRVSIVVWLSWVTAAIAAVVSTSSLFAASAPTGAHVVEFSPQGEIKNVRQVVARFSEAMVPLGDPRRAADPFQIDCPEKATARWVDTRNWAYDFERDVPAGVRCSFTLRPDLATLSGNPIDVATFSFSTGGPAVLSTEPWTGGEVDEEQAFVLFVDAEPTPASVLEHVWFSVDGFAERIGTRLVEGADRDAIVAALYASQRTQPMVIVQARQRFPSGATVVLNWGQGVAGQSGVTTSSTQPLPFKVRKPFTATFSCLRENAKADCMPVSPFRLTFSAAVPRELAAGIVLRGVDGKVWNADIGEREESFHVAAFNPPFPEGASFRIELDADLRDDAGRALGNVDAFPLTVKTSPFPPLAKFSSRFGIIESEAEPVLPVTLRSVEPELQGALTRATAERDTGWSATMNELWERLSGRVRRLDPSEAAAIVPWLTRVAVSPRTRSIFANAPPATSQPSPATASPQHFTLPKPNEPQAMEVVGIPLGAPGLYIVELESPRLGASLLGKDQPMYVPTAALVTNMAVHFKWGGESSLVWVTTLDDAQPVAGAEVIIQDCNLNVVWTGATDATGIARVHGLAPREDLPRCYGAWSYGGGEDYNWLDFDYEQSQALRSIAEGLFVIARTPRDLSFVHSSWKQGIESWRFRLPTASDQSPLTVHTVFDRPLFRAGETVHMKHIARVRSLEGLRPASAEQRPQTMKVEHVGSGDKYDLTFEWSDAGTAHTTWQIPERAKLGAYQVVMERGSSWRDRRVSGSFRVEEFRVPLMRATVGLPAKPQVGVSSIPVELQAHYLAGGGASRLPVVVRAQVRQRPFRAPTELESFTFSNGSVEPGVSRSSGDDGEVSAKPGIHQRLELELDPSGMARTTITDLPAVTQPSDLLVEMEFRDPNGERQTVASTVPLWPADRLVGIEVEDWTSAKDRMRAKVAVVDLEGKPVGDVPVRVEAFKRSTYSHRERLAGGFYAYKHVVEIGPSLGAVCEGTTEANGLYFCEAEPTESGSVVLVAQVEDSGGHKSTAHGEVWIAGDSQWWFDVSHSERIDVIPEKPRYEPGETARFQVRMPFDEATALVTVEREGVAEARVVELSGKNPVIELPVRATHAPNVFVSVLAVRGRIGGVQPTAMLDLGRPAYKLGVAEVRVGWQGHALDVAVEAAAPVYRVRETATARVRVRLPDGGAPPAGSEIAFAAVDEGLLELQGNSSWNLLDAMMGRRGYDVETATAQTQVVGKRHYGLKALPQGGGGGAQSTRELFDTLLLWKGSVALDAAGDAVIEIPLNDSLTSFRLVAIASGGADRFGTGATTIRTTQDLMILPSIPPFVREGDELRAAVTVRNTTDTAQQVDVSAEAGGVGPLAPQTVSLEAGTTAEVGWDIRVPTAVDHIEYVISATGAGGAVDRVRRRQTVRPAVPVRTFQATLAQCDDVLLEPVQLPDDALPGRGGVRVALASSLLAGLDGVEQWIADYPYTCFEQKLARAVVLGDPALWQSLADTLPTYLDNDGLLKFFPSGERGSAVLTAHVLALTHAAGFEIQAEARTRILEALGRFAAGQLVESAVGAFGADLSLRKLAAIEALARYDAAQASMVDSITIEPKLWPTSAVINWWSILLRLPAITDRDTRLGEAEQILRSRLDLAGTSIGFSAQSIDAFGWLMVTPDTNPLRLTLAALEAKVWQDDLPRLMKGALARQQRGAWDSTVSNAWGSVAMRKFAERFESETVTGITAGALGGVEHSVDWSAAPTEAALEFPWPAGRETVSIKHEGTGAPWAVIQAQAAVPLLQPLAAGYRIEKTITPVESKQAGELHAGDILRVRLDVDAQRDMTWVVFDDPVPAGASHLGTGLARDSSITGDAGTADPWDAPTFVERTFAAARAYYEYLPKGRHTFEYTIRLNQGGTFQMPTTRVEALYSPEMFGELPNQPMRVTP